MKGFIYQGHCPECEKKGLKGNLFKPNWTTEHEEKYNEYQILCDNCSYYYFVKKNFKEEE